jgi:hypothetical protein
MGTATSGDTRGVPPRAGSRLASGREPWARQIPAGRALGVAEMRPREILVCSLVSVACEQTALPPIGPTPTPASTTEDGGNTSDGSGSPATADGGARRRSLAPSEPWGNVTTDPNGNDSPDRYCCVNSAFYACPTPAALKQCLSFDLTSCLQSCAPTDDACAQACTKGALRAQRDPSACTRDASGDALCPATGANSSSNASSNSSDPSGSSSDPLSPPPTPKNACGGPFLGTDCDLGMQCIAGGHCTRGKCYPADVGNPCTYPNDCGAGNHCTGGCCANSASDSPCDTGLDCTSGTCTNGTCQ